jgi:DNA-binding response OmpR family regulator
MTYSPLFGSFWYPKAGGHPVAKILMIEDEEMIVALYKRVLTAHDLYFTDSAVMAAKIFDDEYQRGKPFDMVISDYDLTSMTGLDVAVMVRATDPKVPVIVCSGRYDKEIASKALEHDPPVVLDAILMKPFSPIALRNKIAEILASSNPPQS